MTWQSSEYILGSKYARTQNMQVCEYARITQGTDYALIQNMIE